MITCMYSPVIEETAVGVVLHVTYARSTSVFGPVASGSDASATSAIIFVKSDGLTGHGS